jgi:outer membrane lipoprotein-sorting protein
MKSHIFIFALFLTTCLFAEGPTANEIITKVNDLMNQESMKAKMTMTITTSGGDKRTFEYLSYSKNRGEKNLLVYQAPRRVRGQKMLMLNNADDIWAYFARTKRVRKLATHAKRQKMEGSDFSYEDMGANNSFLTDFNSTKIKEEKKEGYDCWVVELAKKSTSSSGYSKMVMWIIKENYLPIAIDYYDEDNPNRIDKTLVQSQIKLIDGIPTGMKYTMTNRNDDSDTIMVLNEVEYNVQLDDMLFTERGLKK